MKQCHHRLDPHRNHARNNIVIMSHTFLVHWTTSKREESGPFSKSALYHSRLMIYIRPRTITPRTVLDDQNRKYSTKCSTNSGTIKNPKASACDKFIVPELSEQYQK